jgi:predicted RNA-binding protein with PIN domain
MANILIDGYNLIGIAHRDFEKARQDIVLQLDRYAGLKRHSITVVFDGWKNGQAAETKIRRANKICGQPLLIRPSDCFSIFNLTIQ